MAAIGELAGAAAAAWPAAAVPHRVRLQGLKALSVHLRPLLLPCPSESRRHCRGGATCRRFGVATVASLLSTGLATACRRRRLSRSRRQHVPRGLPARRAQWHPGSETEEAVSEGLYEEQPPPEMAEEGEQDYSYSSLGIHREMIEDTVRTEAFREAIFQTCRGKVVLEVGCGTGILSVFAAQAGATGVVAVEANAEIASYAEEIIEVNGLRDIVTVVAGRIEEVAEEVGHALSALQGGAAGADVLLSEWMGFMLVCEGMFASVAFARDRWLRQDGIMLPASCSLWAAPFSNPALLEWQTGYWHTNPYGVDLSALATPALEQHLDQPVITRLAPAGRLSSPVCLWSMNCSVAKAEEVAKQGTTFECLVASEGTFHGMAVWFECELCEGVAFSTGPEELRGTHWEQVLLFVDPYSRAFGLPLRPGDRVAGELQWLVEGHTLAVVMKGELGGGAANESAEHMPFSRLLVLRVE